MINLVVKAQVLFAAEIFILVKYHIIFISCEENDIVDTPLVRQFSSKLKFS